MNSLYDEFRVALHSVWTRRWLVLAVAWGICILGWLAIASIPNRYDSRARLLVDVNEILPDEAQMGGGRAHGFDLAVFRIKLLESDTASQFAASPTAPERDVRLPQFVQIKRVHAFRRRVPGHVLQVLAQQCGYLGAGQRIDANQHEES